MYDQEPTYYQLNLEETEADMLMDLLNKAHVEYRGLPDDELVVNVMDMFHATRSMPLVNSPAGLVAKEDFDPYKDYTDSDDYSWVEEEEI